MCFASIPMNRHFTTYSRSGVLNFKSLKTWCHSLLSIQVLLLNLSENSTHLKCFLFSKQCTCIYFLTPMIYKCLFLLNIGLAKKKFASYQNSFVDCLGTLVKTNFTKINLFHQFNLLQGTYSYTT